MITIDWISLLIGAGIVTLIVYLIWIIKPKKKKMGITNLKKIVYDAGIKQKEAYEGIKQLESFFKEVEGM